MQGVRARAADAQLVVITGHGDAALLAQVRALGMADVLSKNAPVADMLAAIAGVLEPLGTSRSKVPSPRQREVLALLAQGLTNKEMARRLGISDATVKIHVARVIEALGAANRTEAVARAQRAGIV